jgi:uncharacterized tellurite resistance protein B-like protein
MSILQWLGLVPRSDSSSDAGVVRRVARALEALPAERAEYLGLFAFMLARVANVDLHVADSETEAMARIVETAGHLPPDQAALVVEIAKAEHRASGETQNFLAARTFRDQSSDAERMDLVHCLFAVAASDGAISVAEEEAIRGISRELRLTERDYVDIRSAYSEHRSVNKA